jgi:hypothetical protein
LQGLRSRQNRSLLIVNEDFGGERNTANGTLWTDTKDMTHDGVLWLQVNIIFNFMEVFVTRKKK